MTACISFFLFVSGFLLLSVYDPSRAILAYSETENGQKVQDNTSTVPVEKKPEIINVVVMVGDVSEANTDTMMLASFNPDTGKLNIMSIPRDTHVDIESMQIAKINGVYRMKNGSSLLMQEIRKITGLDVKYYVYINIKTFREIIDLLGGVDIYIPVDMDYDDPTQDLHIHFKKGMQHLDGKKAELYLRFRKPNNSNYTQELLKYYDGSDLKRIEAQKNFIKELVRQKANFFYLTKLNEIINTVYSNLETNITLGEALKLIKYAVGFDPGNMETFTLPGDIRRIGQYDYFVHDAAKTQEIIGNYFK